MTRPTQYLLTSSICCLTDTDIGSGCAKFNSALLPLVLVYVGLALTQQRGLF